MFPLDVSRCFQPKDLGGHDTQAERALELYDRLGCEDDQFHGQIRGENSDITVEKCRKQIMIWKIETNRE